MKRWTTTAALGAMALGLAACGGGGGGDDGETPETTYNVQAAFATAITTGDHWVTTGELPIGELTLTVDYSPSEPNAFPRTGEAGNVVEMTATAEIGGFTIPEKTTIYYDVGTMKLIGAITSDEGCSVFTKQNVLPTDAKVGDDGVLWESENYATCDANDPNVVSTSVSKWDLRLTNGTVFFCMHQTDKDGDDVVGEQEECYGVDPDGGLTGKARITAEFDDIGTVVTSN